jgi:hypothetical protein
MFYPHMKYVSRIIILSFICLSFGTANADSGALYEAWDEGEAIITEQSGSLVTGGFFYSEDGEMTEPPPPEKPRWTRFKSIEEHGSVIRNTQQNQEQYQPAYESNADPFANRINDIESLLNKE